MTPLLIVATLLIVLASVVCVIEIVKMYQKREVNQLSCEVQNALEHTAQQEETLHDQEQSIVQHKEAIKEYKQRVFNMAIDRMEHEGYALALQHRGTVLSTKERRKLAYSIAEPYAIDYPCNVQNYVPQLADALIASLEEHMEMFAQEQHPAQSTTGRMSPLAGTHVLQSVRPRETPLSTQYYEINGSTEQTRRQTA